MLLESTFRLGGKYKKFNIYGLVGAKSERKDFAELGTMLKGDFEKN